MGQKKRWSAQELGVVTKRQSTVKVEKRMLRLADLHTLPEHKEIPGLVEALGKVMTGKVNPEVRRVPVADLAVPEDEINRQAVAILMEHPPEIGMIPVVELKDGRLLAFDDFHAVTVWQRTSPGALIDVAIVPFDYPE